MDDHIILDELSKPKLNPQIAASVQHASTVRNGPASSHKKHMQNLKEINLNKTGRFANHSYLLLYFYSMDPDRRN
jgi:hypothetical protein